MARKKTNWGVIAGTLAVIGVAYYFLTHRRRKAAGSGGGGAVGAGGGGFPLQQRPQAQQKPSGSGIGLGGAPSIGGSGGSLQSALKRWISGVLNQGYANAAKIPVYSTDLADQSIPYEPLSLFPLSNVDIPDFGNDPGLSLESDSLDGLSIPSEAFNYGDYSPEDFLVTQDIPQQADLSSYGIDPNYGADSLDVQDAGFTQDFTATNELGSIGDYSAEPYYTTAPTF